MNRVIQGRPDRLTNAEVNFDEFSGNSALPAVIFNREGLIVSFNDAFKKIVPVVAECYAGAFLSDVLKGVATHEALLALTPEEDMQVLLPSGPFRLAVSQLSNVDGEEWQVCQLTPNSKIDSTRLRLLLEHLELGVWDFDITKDQFTVSGAWKRIRQIDTATTIFQNIQANGNWWWMNVHEDDLPSLKEAFVQVIEGKKDSANLQYRYQVAADEWCWILCRAKVVSKGADGVPSRVIGLDTDITSFKMGEVEQLELLNKLQLAIGVSGIGVWEYDSATASVYWDDTLLEIYGLTDNKNNRPEDLWETYLHPDDRDATVRESDLALAEQRDFHADYRVVRPDGEIRYVRSASRFVGVSGTAGKMLGVNIDVTEDYARTEELERARQLLEHDSRHDALTGLANRRLLDEHTMSLIDRLGPDDEFAVIHIDLDHFKQVNDQLGHAAGDQVLVRVADTLSALIGNDGLVCRNGGDEFVVLLEHFEGETALRELCQTMIDQMAEPMIMQGNVRSIGLSVGCVISSGDIADASEAFINADVALYAAKSAGRSCFRQFAPSLRLVSKLDVTTYHDLAGAMDAGQVICHFQPQFDTSTLQVVGAEALVRWNCPTRGLVMPDAFIPAAQAAGLSARMDECVLDYVLEQQTAWAQAGLEVPTVALNVSMERLMQPGLVEQVSRQLEPHHSISFELLETSFLDQRTEDLDRVLNKIRNAGIRIDLDDFGSGHSSVVALQSVRPDRVKIDRMLIAPLQENPAQIHILDALVRVARLENCGVVVEGVETQVQLDAVLGLDCEVVQGFLLGRPMASGPFSANLPSRLNETRTANI